MAWNLEEAIAYYRRQGAPGDQNALIALLKEVQTEQGGSISRASVAVMAAELGTKDSLILAIIRRIPSLRLSDSHVLEVCAGPNCGKSAALAKAAEALCAGKRTVTLKFTPCMRQCGKGPNLRWDGTIYNKADEVLLKKLLEE